MKIVPLAQSEGAQGEESLLDRVQQVYTTTLSGDCLIKRTSLLGRVYDLLRSLCCSSRTKGVTDLFYRCMKSPEAVQAHQSLKCEEARRLVAPYLSAASLPECHRAAFAQFHAHCAALTSSSQGAWMGDPEQLQRLSLLQTPAREGATTPSPEVMESLFSGTPCSSSTAELETFQFLLKEGPQLLAQDAAHTPGRRGCSPHAEKDLLLSMKRTLDARKELDGIIHAAKPSDEDPSALGIRQDARRHLHQRAHQTADSIAALQPGQSLGLLVGSDRVAPSLNLPGVDLQQVQGKWESLCSGQPFLEKAQWLEEQAHDFLARRGYTEQRHFDHQRQEEILAKHPDLPVGLLSFLEEVIKKEIAGIYSAQDSRLKEGPWWKNLLSVPVDLIQDGAQAFFTHTLNWGAHSLLDQFLSYAKEEHLHLADELLQALFEDRLSEKLQDLWISFFGQRLRDWQSMLTQQLTKHLRKIPAPLLSLLPNWMGSLSQPSDPLLLRIQRNQNGQYTVTLLTDSSTKRTGQAAEAQRPLIWENVDGAHLSPHLIHALFLHRADSIWHPSTHQGSQSLYESLKRILGAPKALFEDEEPDSPRSGAAAVGDGLLRHELGYSPDQIHRLHFLVQRECIARQWRSSLQGQKISDEQRAQLLSRCRSLLERCLAHQPGTHPDDLKALYATYWELLQKLPASSHVHVEDQPAGNRLLPESLRKPLRSCFHTLGLGTSGMTKEVLCQAADLLLESESDSVRAPLCLFLDEIETSPTSSPPSDPTLLGSLQSIAAEALHYTLWVRPKDFSSLTSSPSPLQILRVARLAALIALALQAPAISLALGVALAVTHILWRILRALGEQVFPEQARALQAWAVHSCLQILISVLPLQQRAALKEALHSLAHWVAEVSGQGPLSYEIHRPVEVPIEEDKEVQAGGQALQPRLVICQLPAAGRPNKESIASLERLCPEQQFEGKALELLSSATPMAPVRALSTLSCPLHPEYPAKPQAKLHTALKIIKALPTPVREGRDAWSCLTDIDDPQEKQEKQEELRYALETLEKISDRLLHFTELNGLSAALISELTVAQFKLYAIADRLARMDPAARLEGFYTVPWILTAWARSFSLDPQQQESRNCALHFLGDAHSLQDLASIQRYFGLNPDSEESLFDHPEILKQMQGQTLFWKQERSSGVELLLREGERLSEKLLKEQEIEEKSSPDEQDATSQSAMSRLTDIPYQKRPILEPVSEESACGDAVEAAYLKRLLLDPDIREKLVRAGFTLPQSAGELSSASSSQGQHLAEASSLPQLLAYLQSDGNVIKETGIQRPTDPILPPSYRCLRAISYRANAALIRQKLRQSPAHQGSGFISDDFLHAPDISSWKERAKRLAESVGKAINTHPALDKRLNKAIDSIATAATWLNDQKPIAHVYSRLPALPHARHCLFSTELMPKSSLSAKWDGYCVSSSSAAPLDESTDILALLRHLHGERESDAAVRNAPGVCFTSLFDPFVPTEHPVEALRDGKQRTFLELAHCSAYDELFRTLDGYLRYPERLQSPDWMLFLHEELTTSARVFMNVRNAPATARMLGQFFSAALTHLQGEQQSLPPSQDVSPELETLLRCQALLIEAGILLQAQCHAAAPQAADAFPSWFAALDQMASSCPSVSTSMKLAYLRTLVYRFRDPDKASEDELADFIFLSLTSPHAPEGRSVISYHEVRQIWLPRVLRALNPEQNPEFCRKLFTRLALHLNGTAPDGHWELVSRTRAQELILLDFTCRGHTLNLSFFSHYWSCGCHIAAEEEVVTTFVTSILGREPQRIDYWGNNTYRVPLDDGYSLQLTPTVTATDELELCPVLVDAKHRTYRPFESSSDAHAEEPHDPTKWTWICREGDRAHILTTEGARILSHTTQVVLSDANSPHLLLGTSEHNQALEDPVEKKTDRLLPPHGLAALSIFQPPDQVKITTVGQQVSSIHFEGYPDLKFKVEEGEAAWERHPHLRLSKNQRPQELDPILANYSRYLLLQEKTGAYRILLPHDMIFSSLFLDKILKKKLPAAWRAFLENALSPLFNETRPYLGRGWSFYSVDATGALTSDDPEACAFLFSLHLMQGNEAGATKILSRLEQLGRHEPLPSILANHLFCVEMLATFSEQASLRNMALRLAALIEENQQTQDSPSPSDQSMTPTWMQAGLFLLQRRMLQQQELTLSSDSLIRDRRTQLVLEGIMRHGMALAKSALGSPANSKIMQKLSKLFPFLKDETSIEERFCHLLLGEELEGHLKILQGRYSTEDLEVQEAGWMLIAQECLSELTPSCQKLLKSCREIVKPTPFLNQSLPLVTRSDGSPPKEATDWNRVPMNLLELEDPARVLMLHFPAYYRLACGIVPASIQEDPKACADFQARSQELMQELYLISASGYSDYEESGFPQRIVNLFLNAHVAPSQSPPSRVARGLLGAGIGALALGTGVPGGWIGKTLKTMTLSGCAWAGSGKASATWPSPDEVDAAWMQLRTSRDKETEETCSHLLNTCCCLSAQAQDQSSSPQSSSTRAVVGTGLILDVAGQLAGVSHLGLGYLAVKYGYRATSSILRHRDAIQQHNQHLVDQTKARREYLDELHYKQRTPLPENLQQALSQENHEFDQKLEDLLLGTDPEEGPAAEAGLQNPSQPNPAAARGPGLEAPSDAEPAVQHGIKKLQESLHHYHQRPAPQARPPVGSSPNDLKRLEEGLQELKQGLESVLPELKESLIQLAFSCPIHSEEDERRAIAAHLKSLDSAGLHPEQQASWEDLVTAFGLDDSLWMEAHTTLLEGDRMQAFEEGMYRYLMAKRRLLQIHKAEVLLKALRSSAHEPAPFAQHHQTLVELLRHPSGYQFQHPCARFLRLCMVLEEKRSLLLRPDQIERTWTELASGEARSLLEFKTGGGKTSTAFPLLDCYAPQGRDCVVTNIFPPALAPVCIPQVTETLASMGVASHTIRGSRSSPPSADRLKGLSHLLEHARQDGDVLNARKTDFQALELLFVELLNQQPESEDQIASADTEETYFRQFCKFLQLNRKHNLVQIDEPQVVLRREEELNHPVGNKTSVNPADAHTVLLVLYTMLQDPGLRALIHSNQQSALSAQQYDEVLKPRLAEQLVLLFDLPPEDSDLVLQYLCGEAVEAPRWLEHHPERRRMSLLKGVLNELLKETIQRRVFLDYGPSKTGKDEFARPYTANNICAEDSTIKEPLETVLKTGLMMLHTRLSTKQAKRLCHKLIKKAHDQAKRAHCTLSRTPAGVALRDWTGHSLDDGSSLHALDRFSTADLTRLAATINQHDEAVLMYALEVISPKITYFPECIKSTSQNFASMFKGFFAASATPDLQAALPTGSRLLEDLGTLGEYADFMRKECSGPEALRIIEACDPQPALEEILASCFGEGSPATALIDAGAYFTGLEGEEVAKVMLRFIMASRPDLHGIIYHDRAGRPVLHRVILDSEGQPDAEATFNAIPEAYVQGPNPPTQREFLTYFDHARRFGANILQPAGAVGIMTPGETLEDDSQGMGRMRGIRKTGQKVWTVLHKKAKEAICGKAPLTRDLLLQHLAKIEALKKAHNNYLAGYQKLHNVVRRKVLDLILEAPSISTGRRLFKQFRSFFVTTNQSDPWELFGAVKKMGDPMKALQAYAHHLHELVGRSAVFSPQDQDSMQEEMQAILQNAEGKLPREVMVPLHTGASPQQLELGQMQQLSQAQVQQQQQQQEQRTEELQRVQQQLRQELDQDDVNPPAPSTPLRETPAAGLSGKATEFFSSTDWLRVADPMEDVNLDKIQFYSVPRSLQCTSRYREYASLFSSNMLWTSNSLGIRRDDTIAAPLSRAHHPISTLLVIQDRRGGQLQTRSIALTQWETEQFAALMRQNRSTPGALCHSKIKIALYDLGAQMIKDTGAHALTENELFEDLAFRRDHLGWMILGGYSQLHPQPSHPFAAKLFEAMEEWLKREKRILPLFKLTKRQLGIGRFAHSMMERLLIGSGWCRFHGTLPGEPLSLRAPATA